MSRVIIDSSKVKLQYAIHHKLAIYCIVIMYTSDIIAPEMLFLFIEIISEQFGLRSLNGLANHGKKMSTYFKFGTVARL